MYSYCKHIRTSHPTNRRNVIPLLLVPDNTEWRAQITKSFVISSVWKPRVKEYIGLVISMMKLVHEITVVHFSTGSNTLSLHLVPTSVFMFRDKTQHSLLTMPYSVQVNAIKVPTTCAS